MDESDKKVRKKWLILWVINMGTAAGNALLQWRYSPPMEGFPQFRYWVAAISLIGSWAMGWLLYHCIYKKPGTKLLTFIFILTGVSLAATPILYLSGKMLPPSYIPFYGAYWLATEALGISWLVVLWKMRKINKKLRAQSV